MCLWPEGLDTPYCSDQLFRNGFHLQRDRHLRWLVTIKSGMDFAAWPDTNGLG
jgi:hypothetical protein